MTLTLQIDHDRWLAHLRRTLAGQPGTVPVLKGNGYGFGVDFLARRMSGLGVEQVAVGTDQELAVVRRHHDGDVIVLTPWSPASDRCHDDPRVVRSVSRADDLRALVSRRHRCRVVVEGRTSLRRHGLSPDELLSLREAGADVEGLALHLPKTGDRLSQVREWTRLAGLRRVYVSWLSCADLEVLTAEFPDVEFRPRIGTSLWLGERSALDAGAEVLEVHPVRPGDPAGYRQRRARRPGCVLVVSGGTSHGIGMRAPVAAAGARGRAAAVAKGVLEGCGMAMSPYRVAGRQRWFFEPPHMQVSLVFLPLGVEPPCPGDRLPVDVRFTTTTFDEVRWREGTGSAPEEPEPDHAPRVIELRAPQRQQHRDVREATRDQARR